MQSFLIEPKKDDDKYYPGRLLGSLVFNEYSFCGVIYEIY